MHAWVVEASNHVTGSPGLVTFDCESGTRERVELGDILHYLSVVLNAETNSHDPEQRSFLYLHVRRVSSGGMNIERCNSSKLAPPPKRH